MSMDITNTDIVDADLVEEFDETECVAEEDSIRAELADIISRQDHVLQRIASAVQRGLWRRHYSDPNEWIAGEFKDASRGLPREERREIGSRLHDEFGMNDRQAAAVLGVSNTTAHEDRITFQNRKVPATHTASDGRQMPTSYKPRAPKPEPAPDPASVNPFTGEVIDNERLIRQRQADEHQRLMDRTIADSLTAIIDAIDYLKGGEEAARIWLDNAYVREADFIPEQDRLTTETVQSAIDYLTTIKKGLHS